MRSKADISQLNLPHGTKLKKWKREKLKSRKTDILRCIDKQSGESAETVLLSRAEIVRCERIFTRRAASLLQFVEAWTCR